jgi:hypothetical protein
MAGFLDFLGPVTAIVGKAMDLIPNANDRAKAQEAIQRALMDAAAQADAGQRDINKIEAASASLFVAGWRPCIGWVGALALGSYYLPQHIMAAVMWTRVAWFADKLPPYPISMDDTLMGLVTAILGIGAMRSFEKFKGVN